MIKFVLLSYFAFISAHEAYSEDEESKIQIEGSGLLSHIFFSEMDKDYYMFFTMPNCEPCNELMKIWDQVEVKNKHKINC